MKIKINKRRKKCKYLANSILKEQNLKQENRIEREGIKIHHCHKEKYTKDSSEKEDVGESSKQKTMLKEVRKKQRERL